ncbi:site-specific integrase [Hymenobacter fodinae]|uniref:Site-specific integrase n=2 Tax=Hymenobacter fodinae TaxID=2510796 RepID=A0A4Z0P117_9BACT|nr:site-specific integrase [Hymenobacter fodinae]
MMNRTPPFAKASMSTPHRLEVWATRLAEFNQEPGLLVPEKNALLECVRAQPLPGSALPPGQGTRPDLARLLEPVRCALAFCGYEEASEPSVLACLDVLVSQMQHRGTSLWAWDEAVWVSLIGKTKQAGSVARAPGLRQLGATPARVREHLMCCAYLLKGIPIYSLVAPGQPVTVAARQLLDHGALQAALATVQTELQRGGWTNSGSNPVLAACLSQALLLARSPHLTDLALPVLQRVHDLAADLPYLRRACILLSKALHGLGILTEALTPGPRLRVGRRGEQDSMPEAWRSLLQRWASTESCNESVRNQVLTAAAKAARWSASQPGAPTPEQWTAPIALQFVAAVKTMRMGQWLHPAHAGRYSLADREMKPASRAQLLSCLRRFFTDCQEWGWLPVQFSPQRLLATPRAIRDECNIKPRVLEHDVWMKLREASATLTVQDLAYAPLTRPDGSTGERRAHYPFEMVRAIAVIWLLAGLRSDELGRLAVGCVRCQPRVTGYAAWLPQDEVPGACYLRVPKHKSGRAFEKPVPQAVGDAVLAWQHVRPATPAQPDPKTGELTDFLFTRRGGTIGRTYLNHRLIPLLCRKAGIPTHDAYGPITSHRARTTLITSLYNSGKMSLLDIMKWMNHKSMRTTLHYIDVPDKRIIDAFLQANAHISQQAKNATPKFPAGHADPPAAPLSRARILESLTTLEQLAAVPTLSAAGRHAIQQGMHALQQQLAQLPPDPEA